MSILPVTCAFASLIAFEHPLPSMHGGRVGVYGDGENGTYNNVEVALPGLMTTKDPKLGLMLWELRKSIYGDRRLVFVDGRQLMCSPNWIRDHVHQMKAFRHWEYDLCSFYDFIVETQRADGQFFELLKQVDDGHWKLVPDDCYRIYPDDHQALVRLELEADIEYLMVEGALRIWRVTGDDGWLRRTLPRLEKGIDYITSDPKRWSKELGLVKRMFTIDTWDFVAEPKKPRERAVEPDSPMSVMHGDNSGVYKAMADLAWINDRLGNPEKAGEWRVRAEALRQAMMKHLWTGSHFMHQLHLNHSGVDGKERERLSLSNAYALNRGVLSREDARRVIAEYQRRRKTTKCFAEWFSIDPPYVPAFGCHKAGTYVNGGISPFTAGELALGAFENGYEEYGYDIIVRLRQMVERDKAVYFLYTPDEAKPLGGGPSGWGSASIMNAIDEGLAGIRDADTGYAVIDFSPRWPVTEYAELRYVTGYESSRKFVDCRYVLTGKGMRYRLASPARRVNAHILLPRGRKVGDVRVNGEGACGWALENVGESVYVNWSGPARDAVDFEILFKE